MASIYIRLFMMANQFMLLSSLSEITEWNTTSQADNVSLSIAFLIFVSCIAVIVISIIVWWNTRDGVSDDDQLMMKELVAGLKDQHKARLYSTFLLSRRAALV